jgi:hypothetical protein
MHHQLKPWLAIAQPHEDIRDGSFDESLFAADLGLVANGQGPRDYVDPELFAQKTYLTDNLRAALVEVGNRLGGDTGSAAVFRMQTEFGGGKTHTLLAAYHLYGSPDKVATTTLGQDLATELKSGTLPSARVAVLDGSALTVDPETMPDGVTIHSFLGHLAWRLGGSSSYEKVRAKDEGLRGTSTVEMVNLLTAAAPCLILLDETLEYLNKALEMSAHDGNLAATTLTVIKELCTAVSNVPGAAIIATLTSSRLEDYSTVAGEEMQERLSKVVGRTENIVTPVEGDDIFPILHTRLFESIGDRTERRAVADAYASWYDELGDVLPQQYRDPTYRDRIEQAFPFHPELIDILTNRWGSLSGFQRTRGALRTLAHTVKCLAQRNHQGTLIHAGDMPLADPGVRAEVIRFAGESFKSALNADIIRSDSKAAEEDRRRGGEIEKNGIAVGLATTAFLNSFGADKVLGASAPQMLIGVGRPNPGLSRGVLDDVRDALSGSLWYMRYEGGRYRFTTEPNLNKVIVEREGAIGDDRLTELIREATKKVAPQTEPFQVITSVTGSTDLPDEPRLTIGVLDARSSIGPEQRSETTALADASLNTRGTAARTNKNAVVLVAGDSAGVTKARQTARTLAAMRDLTRDQVRLKRFNQEQRDQLAERLASAEQRLPQQITMAYRYLVILGSDGGNGSRVDLIDLGPTRATATIPGRVLEYLKTNDRLLDATLAPAALLTDRFGVLPAGEQAIELDRLLGYFYRLPRLPKLADADVLRRCLVQGVASGTFGLASGSSWDASDAVLRYQSSIDPSEVQFQPGTWLVRAAVIAPRYAARSATSQSDEADDTKAPHDEMVDDSNDATDARRSDARNASAEPESVSVSISAVPADKIRDVVKVAVMPLASGGAEIKVDVEIRAHNPNGISRNTLDLVVGEGLRQLGVEHEIVEQSAEG